MHSLPFCLCNDSISSEYDWRGAAKVSNAGVAKDHGKTNGAGRLITTLRKINVLALLLHVLCTYRLKIA